MAGAPRPDDIVRVSIGRDVTETVLAERFGAPPLEGATVVLLLSEAEAPSTRWPSALLEGLLGEVDTIIRFDTRGAGRNAGAEPGYSLDDLADDAVAVLDHFGISAAHLLGRSMGGMVAQLLAIDRSDRVQTMTLLSTTAGPHPGLGGPKRWLVDRMSERLFEGPPSGLEARADWIAEQQEWFAGSRFPFDREHVRRWARVEAESHWHDEIAHGEAVVGSEPRYERLDVVVAPTLIIHGTADPVYPVDHAHALHAVIPRAELRLIEGLGHELPPGFVHQLVSMILAHVAAKH